MTGGAGSLSQQSRVGERKIQNENRGWKVEDGKTNGG